MPDLPPPNDLRGIKRVIMQMYMEGKNPKQIAHKLNYKSTTYVYNVIKEFSTRGGKHQ